MPSPYPSQRNHRIPDKIRERQEAADDGKGIIKKDGRYIEILFGFSWHEKSAKPWRLPWERDRSQGRDERLYLRLVEEIVQKNRGIVKIKADDDKMITLISLIYPSSEGNRSISSRRRSDTHRPSI